MPNINYTSYKPHHHINDSRFNILFSQKAIGKSHLLKHLCLEPRTSIMGGPDIHLKEGSTMNLTCIITDSPEPPSYIFWRHNDGVSIVKISKNCKYIITWAEAY